MNNKKWIIKTLLLIAILIISKITIIKPIEEKKKLLEKEEYKIKQDLNDIEEYKKEAEILKRENNSKKIEKIFSGRDDVIEVQNTINRIVDIQSIENMVELDETGKEISNINIKFIGTYEDIFKVIDALNSRGVGKKIKMIKISKVNQSIKIENTSTEQNQISDIIPISKDSSEKKSNQQSIKFECTLKITK